MAKITKIEPLAPAIKTRKRVAAYARISMETERMNHSLSAQISYYNALIQKNPEWEFAGVYSDDGISGTGTQKRTGFKQMLSAAENGEIDIILTKSIQRFARNTVDLLETVRRLKDIGVEVRFEKENINSLSDDGELMLTILASFAQEESRSISENVKWSVRKRFEKGIPNGRFQIYGYRWQGDKLIIEPEEAEIVRLIYDNFLKGLSAETTEKQLEEMGVKSYKGAHFSNTSIRQILSNITYTGNLLFQKEYTVDPISGKSKLNRGELPQYFAENTHEAIIPLEVYQTVQQERERRKELGVFANWSINTSCFTSKLKCGVCGKSFRRSGKHYVYGSNDYVYYIWICRTKSDKGAKYCSAKCIPENTLKKICAEVLCTDEFEEALFADKVNYISVVGDDLLEFHFNDGSIINKKWKSTARIDSWTDERRKAWSEMRKDKANNPNRYKCKEFTGFIRCSCGSNYRTQGGKYVDGTKVRTWRCGNHCGAISIRDEILKAMVCEVLGLAEFSENEMTAKLEGIYVNGDILTFGFLDGRSETRQYIKPKKRGQKHSQEHKAYMSKMMKNLWKEGKLSGGKKSNNNSGNNQSLHGGSD